MKKRRLLWPEGMALIAMGLILCGLAAPSVRTIYHKVRQKIAAFRPMDDYHLPWSLENESERLELPEFRIVPAALESELTPASPDGPDESGSVWMRSHGGHANLRFSSSKALNPENVIGLELAWIYHSKDGQGNIQCNPVFADGRVYTPTVGNHVVAVDAETGREVWRFRPLGRPAHRGLIWLPADKGMPSRILFSSGEYLYCLNAETGKPISSFGRDGHAQAVWCAAAPAVHDDLIILAGFTGGVFAYHLNDGSPAWKFETIPGGHDGPPDENWTYNRHGANCWGGTALDEKRGIFFISTGSPKPNFFGNDQTGANLYANCVVAIDARTGEKLWHFQEISHDIWDLDLPAPPNLTTITRNGKKYDVVTAVTKLGNTLILDRVSGKPIYEFRLRRAPVSRLPGERTQPYQPAIERPEPFARQEFTLDDVTDISPESTTAVMGKIHPAGMTTRVNFGWFETFEPGKPTLFYGIHGGAEWTGACIDPENSLLYVTSNQIAWMPTVNFSLGQTGIEAARKHVNGYSIYQKYCTQCHGPDRTGTGMAPPLLAVRFKMDRHQIASILSQGKNLMPPFPQLTTQDKNDLINFLVDEAGENSEAVTDQKPMNGDRIYDRSPQYTVDGHVKLTDHLGYPGTKPPWGTLNCIDLNSGDLKWQVPLGEYMELSAQGIPKTGMENFGGATVTAGGLVFAGGTPDRMIRAFNKWTGEEIWKAELPFGGYAPPTVFQYQNSHYLVIPATGGGKLGGPEGDAMVAFRLRGDARMIGSAANLP